MIMGPFAEDFLFFFSHKKKMSVREFKKKKKTAS